jgi:xanthine dehydrogenase YagR molybdenum-binding subunit
MAEMKEWGPRTLTGKDHQRIDAVEKVTGKARYTYDVKLPGLLIGRVLRSPHPHAKVVSVDLTQASNHPQVKSVVDFEKKTVRYAGEEVAAVAAETAEAAEEALRLIEVEYEILPFAVVEEQAMAEGAPDIHPQGNVVVPERRQREKGDLVAGFAEADAVVEQTYRTQVQNHNSLETHGATATWDVDQLTVYSSTQGIVGVRDQLAKYFKIPTSQVRVLTEHMGGGFGSKFGAGVEGMCAARLSKAAGAPVQLMMTRKEENLCVGNRPSAIMKLKVGAAKDGTFTAFESFTYGTGGIGGVGNIPLPYVFNEIPNVKSALHDVHTNAGGARAMRAPGHPQAAFAMDIVMDELAYKLGIDPLDMRLTNGCRNKETRDEQLRIGAREIGWDRRNKVPGSGEGPIKRGIGLGCGEWGGSGRKGTFAEVVIHPDGGVDAKSATQDLGTGTRTLIALVAAEELGLGLDQVRALLGDTNYPPGRASGGSTTAPSTSPAVKAAARKAKHQLFEKIAPGLGVAPSELRTESGRIVASNGTSLSWNEATSQLGVQPIVVVSEFEDGFSGVGTAGVHFAEVEVDVETGRIQPIKIVAVNDCGLVVNKLLTESQVNGGVIGGLSYALLEDRVLDPNVGVMLNPGFEPYKVAGAFEIPEIVPILMDMPERGVIGIGEPATIPTAGALANAVFNAIGVPVRELPMTPDKVLAALSA